MSVAFDGSQDTAFRGAKLALFLGDALVTILRDDIPDIPWPGHWDLPGGGREGLESGAACALRETHEELGLVLPQTALSWGRLYRRKGHAFWFFAAHLPGHAASQIRFGNEGQYWQLIDPHEYLRRDKAIPQFQSRLADYLAES